MERNNEKGIEMEARTWMEYDNGSFRCGIYVNNGTITVLTGARSRTFKTVQGAYNWAKSMGVVQKCRALGFVGSVSALTGKGNDNERAK